jgi:predicted aspartyl protease
MLGHASDGRGCDVHRHRRARKGMVPHTGSGARMIDDMGIFRTDISVAPLSSPDNRRELRDVMVDTGSEYNWIPRGMLLELGIAPVRLDRFETADGRVLEREVGFALLYAGGRSTASVVVFAGDGDMVLLGAIGLEGLNLRVDLARKELVPAGPLPAAGITLEVADSSTFAINVRMPRVTRTAA